MSSLLDNLINKKTLTALFGSSHSDKGNISTGVSVEDFEDLLVEFHSVSIFVEGDYLESLDLVGHWLL